MKAELIDYMGDDLRVVNAARVSFNKESDWKPYKDWGDGILFTSNDLTLEEADGKMLDKRDEKLIKYLANHGHWTPFSHPMITVRETVPIFVARQRFKHMVGFTYNEVSRRYVDDPPEFYVPDEWRGKPKNAKQGSSDEVITKIVMRNNVEQWDSPIDNAYQLFIETAEQLYNSMIEAGVAPEQARMVLPQSMYTSYYVTGSLAAWARAYKQRIDGHAQKEIQDLAKQWDNLIRDLFPISWQCLTE